MFGEAISLSWTECLHAAKMTWTYLNSELYGFLPCKSLEAIYGSVKLIFENKINCFTFNEPKSPILFVKHEKRATTSQKKLLRLVQSSAVVMASTKIRTISERFPSAFEDSFKTTFCSFSRVSKHFWKKSDKFISVSQFCVNFRKVTLATGIPL